MRCKVIRSALLVVLLANMGLGARAQETSLDAVMVRLRDGSDGKTPTVKQFNRQWVRSLTQRGRLKLKTLAFDLPNDCKVFNLSVKCAGRTVKENYEMKNNRIVIDLLNNVNIQRGQAIEVKIVFGKS